MGEYVLVNVVSCNIAVLKSLSIVKVDVYPHFDVLTVQLYKVQTGMLVIVPVNSGFSATLTKCL